MMEGPQQILQLTLQHQADDFMKEEITDADDYADWIQWAADGVMLNYFFLKINVLLNPLI